MEFRLNKIDTDLRQKINELTKEGKVHTVEKIQVNKDKHKEKKERKQDERGKGRKLSNPERYNFNKKLVIEAVKIESIEIEAFKEEDKNTKIEKGSIIDIRR